MGGAGEELRKLGFRARLSRDFGRDEDSEARVRACAGKPDAAA